MDNKELWERYPDSWYIQYGLCGPVHSSLVNLQIDRKQMYFTRMGSLAKMDSLKELRLKLKQFAEERDWRQFHSPKNLTMALCGEAGELSEQFQWLSEDDSKNLSEKRLAAVKDEIADIQLYLVLLADSLGVDIAEESARKIEANALKYPVAKAKGRSNKYDEL
ncbi:nucleotide pyrophosphohydrolase [Marinobacter sp.]|uniref:nucleotide pyrophosphohydrolase n=1 Tax=Marinobacter sp. TaxID=50741 RepID=UPI003A8E4BA3